MEIRRLTLACLAGAAVVAAACGTPDSPEPDTGSSAPVPALAESEGSNEIASDDAQLIAETSSSQSKEPDSMVTQTELSPTQWGPFILYPSGTRIEDLPRVDLPPELDAYSDLDSYSSDERIARFDALDSEALGPAGSRLRVPSNLAKDLILSSVSTVRMDDGTLVTSALLWHDTPDAVGDFAPETAELAITRSLLRPRPSHLVLPGTLPPGGTITAWTIETVEVAGIPALFHRFVNDPRGDRAGQGRNAVEWFDDEGYINIVSGFGLSADELITIAESLR